MAGAAAKGAVGGPREPDLRLIDRLDHQPRFPDEIIERQTCRGTACHVDPNRRLEPGCRRDASAARPFDGRGVGRRVVLGEQDGQQRGTVDDHRGSPRSS